MAAVFIAVLALVFTVASFWWLHARPGHLVGNRPGEYAMALTPEQSRFRFGLVVYNTGARTLVVEALRLTITDERGALGWITTRDRLRPDPDERIDFSTAFAVDGRRAVQLFVEFGETPPRWRPDAGTTHEVAIEARALGRQEWSSVSRFPLTIPSSDLDRYITRSNPAVDAG